MNDEEELERIRTGLSREIESCRNKITNLHLNFYVLEKLLLKDNLRGEDLQNTVDVGYNTVEVLEEILKEFSDYVEDLRYYAEQIQPTYKGSN